MNFEFKNDTHKKLWEEIIKKKGFPKLLKRALRETLFIGDGAYKISIDTRISKYPLIEWYPGERIEIVRGRGGISEIIFKTAYTSDHKQYVLHEHYGHGYIKNHLYKDEKEVSLTELEVTKDIQDVEFDNSVMLAVSQMIYENTKYEGRGGSIFDTKLDNFDALDEAWSQWMDALRAGRSKEYIPDSLIPRDPDTGKIIKPNAFDNRYITTGNDMGEDAKNVITLHQPEIHHGSYLATYITALDLCLQGIVSPSTLGIDVKKLDTADAQREKEKTTLYSRDAIIEALQETLPELVSAAINACKILEKKAVEEVEVEITFGEYANPSFESQVETIGKAKTQGIMSVEACVDELYGDTKDDDWKKAEVTRLKTEQGIAIVEEPGVNMKAGNFNVNLEGTSHAGKSNEKNIPDEPEGIPGTSESGK